MRPKSSNITFHPGKVTAQQRSSVTGAVGTIVWLTGLSGCGKSTVAVALEEALVAAGCAAYVLDGDNIRHGLNANLGFSPEDRTENIRRIGQVARLFADAGMIAIASFISPYRADRDAVRALVKPGEFVEIFVDAPLELCEQRDPKGLYEKARADVAAGKSPQFTGIDAPYEAPQSPEIHLHTDRQNTAECVQIILEYLGKQQKLVPLRALFPSGRRGAQRLPWQKPLPEDEANA